MTWPWSAFRDVQVAVAVKVNDHDDDHENTSYLKMVHQRLEKRTTGARVGTAVRRIRA